MAHHDFSEVIQLSMILFQYSLEEYCAVYVCVIV